MTQILSTWLSKLEKLKESRTLVVETTSKRQWNHALWAQNHYWTKSFSLGDHVLWFPKAHKEHTCKFKQNWFGPYKIKYCLLNNTTLLVTIDKFDPNPILVNINKLKPYWFQDITFFRGLESTIKRGRDTTNTEIRFNIVTLENVQGTCTKFSFLMNGTEIQESSLGTKNQDLVVGIQIQDLLAPTKKLEDRIGIEICTIESRIKNLFPRIRIQDSEWTTKILGSGSLRELNEIVESG